MAHPARRSAARMLLRSSVSNRVRRRRPARAVRGDATPPSSTAAGSAGSIRPGRRALESYFRGVLLVPERELFVARLNGVIVGSAHLVRPPRNNEAQAFAAS